MPPELDIVVYAVNADDTGAAGARARELFERAAEKGLHLAIMELPTALAMQWLDGIEPTSETISCLRSVLMKPEHADWCDSSRRTAGGMRGRLAAL